MGALGWIRATTTGHRTRLRRLRRAERPRGSSVLGCQGRSDAHEKNFRANGPDGAGGQGTLQEAGLSICRVRRSPRLWPVGGFDARARSTGPPHSRGVWALWGAWRPCSKGPGSRVPTAAAGKQRHQTTTSDESRCHEPCAAAERRDAADEGRMELGCSILIGRHRAVRLSSSGRPEGAPLAADPRCSADPWAP